MPMPKVWISKLQLICQIAYTPLIWLKNKNASVARRATCAIEFCRYHYILSITRFFYRNSKKEKICTSMNKKTKKKKGNHLAKKA